MPPRPFAGLAPLTGALALIAGCQTYQPRPLDLAAHREAWLARGPASPAVADLARRLAESGGDQAGPFDPTDGLSLHEAEVIALVYNPDLRIARLKAGVTQAAAQYAGLWDDPMLGGDIKRVLDGPGRRWQGMGVVSFTLPISGRLQAEKRRAGAEHAADVLRIHEQEWMIRIALRRQWAEWSALEERVAAERDYHDRLDRLLGIIDRLERAGEMARIQTGLFRIEQARHRAMLAQAQGARDGAAIELRRLMGLAPAAAVALIPAFAAPAPDPAELLAERAARDNPALAVAAAEHQTAEHALALEIRKQYPDLTIGPGLERDGESDMALVSLSIPLPLLNRNRQGIATASAQRQTARAVFEAIYERLMGDLAAARVQYDTAVAQRRIFESEVVPLVDQQYADARRIAELGEVDTMLLLETLSRQLDAKLALIDTHLAEALASLRLDELAGPLTPGMRSVLGPNPADSAPLHPQPTPEPP